MGDRSGAEVGKVVALEGYNMKMNIESLMSWGI